MASTNLLLCFLSLLLFIHPFSAADILAPLLSPFLDDICKDVMCGKGKCRASANSTFDFRCECDKGWKRSVEDDERRLGFLPCVIPNCTVNYSCAKAEPPAPARQEPPTNKSLFDPCFWAYCGEGTCLKTEKMSHKCECNPGHSNLFNVSSFPCFNDCALGADCKELGIVLSNVSSAASPSSLAGDDTSDASSVSLGNLLWLGVFIIISTAFVPWT
ncbi:hypothetical protein Syun_029362 [Stephania yunnanensis]|uniref:EGF-like domain-containing protein n=1 Tax=Stephania yunnanensis TaxID=152371 RepID=A0AAP0HFY5_9MAGN